MRDPGAAAFLRQMHERVAGSSVNGPPPPVDHGGGGDDGGMEKRLRDVEDAVMRINTILPTLATKEDVHKEINVQTWRFVTWMTSVGIALTAAVYFIARNVH